MCYSLLFFCLLDIILLNLPPPLLSIVIPFPVPITRLLSLLTLILSSIPQSLLTFTSTIYKTWTYSSLPYNFSKHFSQEVPPDVHPVHQPTVNPNPNPNPNPPPPLPLMVYGTVSVGGRTNSTLWDPLNLILEGVLGFGLLSLLLKILYILQ